MKTMVLLILLLSNLVYSQDAIARNKHEKPPRYGIIFYKKTNKPYWNQRGQLKKYLMQYNNTKHQTQDRLGKLYCENLHYLDTLSGRTRLPDSLQLDFIIKGIEKKQDNFQVVNGHLSRTTIYLIDIEPKYTSNQYPKHMRILSVEKNNKKSLNKIKKDSTYKIIIYPFFYVDVFSAYFNEGKYVSPVLQPLQSKYPILYDNIWIPYIDFTPYNWFWSPNIVGECYIP